MNVPIRLAGLLAIALLALVASLLVGGSYVTPGDLLYALAHPHANTAVVTILWQLRMPRVCIAAVVGAELAIAAHCCKGAAQSAGRLVSDGRQQARPRPRALWCGRLGTALPAVGFVAGPAPRCWSPRSRGAARGWMRSA